MIRLSEMPLILQKAVVAGEDALFTNTRAMRPDAMISTIRRYIAQTGTCAGQHDYDAVGAQRGRSHRSVEERTASHKLRMIAALQVEREFTKDEILELYLNQVYFGGSAHGVEAAAQYFKAVQGLSLKKAATLAEPAFAHAFRRCLEASQSDATCADRMLEHGFIRQVGMTGARHVGPGLCAHTEKRARNWRKTKYLRAEHLRRLTSCGDEFAHCAMGFRGRGLRKRRRDHHHARCACRRRRRTLFAQLEKLISSS